MHGTETWTGHHAVLAVGEREAAYARLEAALGISLRSGGPDLSLIERESFGVDDARELRRVAYGAPAGGVRRFVIAAPDIGREAQNMLLKLLEDPPPRAQFVLVLPRADLLLPTLRSRLAFAFEVRAERAKAEKTKPIGDTLAYLAKEMKEKNRESVEAYLAETESRLAADRGILTAAGPDLMLARRYFPAKGASHKMLAEHLALSVAESEPSR